MVISWIFIQVVHPLYICKRNQQAAMDKEDFGLIAAIEQKSIAIAITICCGVLNPRIFEAIIDFVTQSQPEGTRRG